MRLPTPGLGWLSGPETGLKNGSVRALQPALKTLFGPKRNKYNLFTVGCSSLFFPTQILHTNFFLSFYETLVHKTF